MRAREAFELPPERQADMERAKRLEWTTIAFMISIVAVIYLTMGSSQAMKSAWVEDLLSLVPPIAFLVAARVRDRPPDEDFPYGYHRAVSIAFLTGSVALLGFGLYVLIDSVIGLVRADRPLIGQSVVFGRSVWSGWLMIAALAYSAVPPLVLGRMKVPLASRLHDKTLKADSDMNRADWLTAGAGIVGILGLRAGWWWADGVAASTIAVDIVRDGGLNLARVTKDLMDQRPTRVEGGPSRLPDDVRRAVGALPWVQRVEVRLREEGHVYVGEVFLAPGDGVLTGERAQEVVRVARDVDWRVHDVVPSLILEHGAPPRASRGG